jgi:imidazole glycerol-phosphate synthase subunit HisH
MSLKIAIVNYGMGNLHSVYKKLIELKTQAIIATTASQILSADKIILPGVGHFEKAIINLRQLDIYDAINEFVVVKKKPILGICLGMQLMARESEEGKALGFGWFDARVVRFRIHDRIKYKVPQTGWNTIKICKESNLLKKIDDDSEFYFLHSYHYEVSHKEDILTNTEFEYEFVSGVEKENIFGTQFHPEKSHTAGTQIFKNFIQL